MENNAFENFNGVTVRSRQPARKVNNDFWHKASSIVCGLAMTALFLWTVLQIVTFLLIPESGEIFPSFKVLIGAIGALFFCLTGFDLAPRWEPECYELQISEDCSAVSLLQIQASWDLKQGPEQGVWVATSKSALKNLPKREW